MRIGLFRDVLNCNRVFWETPPQVYVFFLSSWSKRVSVKIILEEFPRSIFGPEFNKMSCISHLLVLNPHTYTKIMEWILWGETFVVRFR